MKDHSKLTRLHAIRERQARVELGRASKKKSDADDELAKRRQDHKSAIEDHASTDPGHLEATHLSQVATNESREAAEVKMFHAELESRAARGAWQRSLQDMEMAEKLEDRRRQDLAQIARRTSERALDELMTLRRRHK